MTSRCLLTERGGTQTIERVPGAAQQFQVRLRTPRGSVVALGARHSVRESDTAMRLEATGLEGCSVTLRFSAESGGTRVAVRIFGVGRIHPDFAKTGDSTLAVPARNHAAMVECMLAASKLGAELLLLNRLGCTPDRRAGA